MSPNLRVGNYLRNINLIRLHSQKNKHQSIEKTNNQISSSKLLSNHIIRYSALRNGDVKFTLKRSNKSILWGKISIDKTSSEQLTAIISHVDSDFASKVDIKHIGRWGLKDNTAHLYNVLNAPSDEAYSREMKTNVRSIFLLENGKVLFEVKRDRNEAEVDEKSLQLASYFGYELTVEHLPITTPTSGAPTKKVTKQPSRKATTTKKKPAPQRKVTPKPAKTALPRFSQLASILRQLRFWTPSTSVVPTVQSASPQIISKVNPANPLAETLKSFCQQVQSSQFEPWIVNNSSDHAELEKFIKESLAGKTLKKLSASQLRYLEALNTSIILIGHPTEPKELFDLLDIAKGKRIYIPSKTAEGSLSSRISAIEQDNTLFRIVSVSSSGQCIIQSRKGIGFARFKNSKFELFPDTTKISSTISAALSKRRSSYILREELIAQALSLGYEHSLVSQLINSLPPLAFELIEGEDKETGRLRIYTSTDYISQEWNSLIEVFPNLQGMSFVRGLNISPYNSTENDPINCFFELPTEEVVFHLKVKDKTLKPLFRVNLLEEGYRITSSINLIRALEYIKLQQMGHVKSPLSTTITRQATTSLSVSPGTKEDPLAKYENTLLLDSLFTPEKDSRVASREEQLRQSEQELNDFMAERFSELADTTIPSRGPSGQ